MMEYLKIWDLAKSKYANLIKTFIMDVNYETKNIL